MLTPIFDQKLILAVADDDIAIFWLKIKKQVCEPVLQNFFTAVIII
jgi:hypothetical protein